MEPRFAGSQRVDERRRRRLATESDQLVESPSDASARRELPAPQGATRIAHSAEGASQVDALTSLVDFPLPSLIPAALWKHLAGGLACLVIAGAILLAGCYEKTLAGLVGPAFARLFAPGDGPVGVFYASCVLWGASQVALLIWWVRSRSLKDFDGRYRIWKKVAAALALFSFCVASGAHRACGDTVAWFWHAPFWRRDLLAWAVPATLTACVLFLSIRREVRGCRSSWRCLHAAAVLYGAALAIQCGVPVVESAATNALVLQGILFLGHIVLLLGMTLHARHVIFSTAEPTEIVRRRRFKIPKPHFHLPKPRFKLPSLRRAARVSGTGASADRTDGVTSPPVSETTRSPGTKKKSAVTSAADAVEPEASKGPATKPRIRLDGKHSDGPRSAAATDSSTAASDERDDDQGESSPEPQPARGNAPPRPAEPASAPPAPANKSSINEAAVDESTDESDDEGADDGAGNHGRPNRSELAGLSKKQRRRMQQEQRERERGRGGRMRDDE